MMKFRDLKDVLLYKLLPKSIYNIYKHYSYNINPNKFTFIGQNVHLIPPLYICVKSVELESFTRLQTGVQIISNPKQKVRIKKYTSIGAETIIIPGSHVPTVGLPQFLSYTGINDINGTLIIPEDVWVGARCIILPKAKIGRGCVVAAGSIVNKTYPPYSVIAGSPAKIIAVRFSLEQIIKHEMSLYDQRERLDKTYLQGLFGNEYKDLRIIGTDMISEEDIALMESTKESLNM